MLADATDSPHRLLSPADAQRRYGRPAECWRTLILAGEIPAYEIGMRRFMKAEDVEHWLESRRYVPPESGDGPH